MLHKLSKGLSKGSPAAVALRFKAASPDEVAEQIFDAVTPLGEPDPSRSRMLSSFETPRVLGPVLQARLQSFDYVDLFAVQDASGTPLGYAVRAGQSYGWNWHHRIEIVDVFDLTGRYLGGRYADTQDR
jgi:hypothetical protein